MKITKVIKCINNLSEKSKQIVDKNIKTQFNLGFFKISQYCLHQSLKDRAASKLFSMQYAMVNRMRAEGFYAIMRRA